SCGQGWVGGVLGSGTTGTDVRGGRVRVRGGLEIEGQATAGNSTRHTTPATLFIEKSTINNFICAGIDIEPSGGASQVFITDTIVRNNGGGGATPRNAGGILFKPAGGGGNGLSVKVPSGGDGFWV